MSSIDALRMWTLQRWGIALVSGIAVAALVALPTAVIPNPIFGRAIEVTWWSYPVVILSGIFGGMLLATYIKEPGAEEIDKAAKVGGGRQIPCVLRRRLPGVQQTGAARVGHLRRDDLVRSRAAIPRSCFCYFDGLGAANSLARQDLLRDAEGNRRRMTDRWIVASSGGFVGT